MLSTSSKRLLDCIDQPVLLVGKCGGIIYANEPAVEIADAFRRMTDGQGGNRPDWLARFHATTAPMPQKVDLPGIGPISMTGQRLKIPELRRQTVMLKFDMEEKEKYLFRAVKKRVDKLTAALRNERRKTRILQDAAKALNQKANTDALTSLMTRGAFETALRRAVAFGTTAGSLLIALDLNDFKTVNDTYGHQAGDHVLSACGERICALIRKRDFAARLGGDEFCIYLPDRLTLKSARRILARLHDGLAEPIPHRLPGAAETVLLKVTASIGAVIVEPGVNDADALLFSADQAMYECKRSESRRPVLRTKLTDPGEKSALRQVG